MQAWCAGARPGPENYPNSGRGLKIIPEIFPFFELIINFERPHPEVTQPHLLKTVA